MTFSPDLLLIYRYIDTYMFIDMYTYIHIYMYIYTCIYICITSVLFFTPASPLLIHVTAVILLYLHIFVCTAALLVLYSYVSCHECVCVCAGLLA